MAKKSNKTDHVLNLLSSGGKKSAAKKEPKKVKEEPPVEILAEDEYEEETEYEEEVEEPPVKKSSGKKSAARKKANVSVVYKTTEEESPIAEAVKDSLEQELDAYLKEKETQLQENVAKAEAKIKEDVEKNTEARIAAEEKKTEDNEDKDEAVKTAREKIQLAELDVRALMMQVQEEEMEDTAEEIVEEPVQEEPIAEPEPEEVPVVQEKPQEEIRLRPIPEPAADQPKVVTDALSAQQGLIDDVVEDANYVTLNIMEILVKMMAPELVKQFGHCDCRRCMADTIALALTNLPAKYVVVNKGTESPLINFYERKYSGQLTVEITKASMIVHENPNH